MEMSVHVSFSNRHTSISEASRRKKKCSKDVSSGETFKWLNCVKVLKGNYLQASAIYSSEQRILHCIEEQTDI